MGGGVGLSAHGAHRIVTERSKLGHAGSRHRLLSRRRRLLSAGARAGRARHPPGADRRPHGAADAICCGLADIHVPCRESLPSCRGARRRADRRRCPRDARGNVRQRAGPGRSLAARPWIDDCFGADDVEEIVGRAARAATTDGASRRCHPGENVADSLKVDAAQSLRRRASCQTLEESSSRSTASRSRCIAGHDFIEGIRAPIVDKDRNPRWRPDTLEDVTPRNRRPPFPTPSARSN